MKKFIKEAPLKDSGNNNEEDKEFIAKSRKIADVRICKIFLLIVGIILVALQLIVVWNNDQASSSPWNRSDFLQGNFEAVSYDIANYIGYTFVGVIGTFIINISRSTDCYGNVKMSSAIVKTIITYFVFSALVFLSSYLSHLY